MGGGGGHGLKHVFIKGEVLQNDTDWHKGKGGGSKIVQNI
jgi:hypothetical protein